MVGRVADAARDPSRVALAVAVQDLDRHQLRPVGEPGEADRVPGPLGDRPGEPVGVGRLRPQVLKVDPGAIGLGHLAPDLLRPGDERVLPPGQPGERLGVLGGPPLPLVLQFLP